MSIFSIFRDTSLNGNSNANVLEINGYTLPPNVVFSIDFEKVIAEHQILDGTAVFERIAERPRRVTFEFSFIKTSNMNIVDGKISPVEKVTTNRMGQPVDVYEYPIQMFQEFLQKVWIENKVIEVKNSLLNAAGIFYVVIQTGSAMPERGRMDLPMKLFALEDKYTTNSKKTSLLI